MIKECRICKGKVDEVMQKKDLIFVLCKDCGLFQLKQLSPSEVDFNHSFAQLAKDLPDDATLEGLYLPSILKNKRPDLLTIDTPVYFTILSLQRALTPHRLEIYIADIQENIFRAGIRHVSSLKRMRLDETDMKMRSKNTYLLFSFTIHG